MDIREVLEIQIEDDDTFYVTAVAEDCILKYKQTLYDPEEYGPAIVTGFVSMTDIRNYEGLFGLKIPTESPLDAVKEYLEAIDYDINWSVADYDNY